MKYPTCTLGNFINPGKYCVISIDKEHVSKVAELERKMKEEMFHDNASGYELCSQMCVAVTNPEQKFRRGVIERKLADGSYKVFLVDYGKVIQIKKSNLKVITNQDFMKIEPLSFIVRLYGLIPTKYSSDGTVCKHKASDTWRPESVEFVQNLFKKQNKVVVKSICIRQRTVYGDLFIQQEPKMKYVSLSKLLCNNKFCIYSESNFLREEGLDPSIDSTEYEEKMELVEKWQRENFGEEKVTLQSSSSAPSPANGEGGIPSSDDSSRSPFNEELDQTHKMFSEEEVPKAGPVEPRGIGIGRGRIKHLIAEMKKKEGSSSELCGSFPTSSSGKPETKVSLGRGQFLKKYLELQKPLKPTGEVSPCAHSTVSGSTEISTVPDVGKPSEEKCEREVVPEVENAVENPSKVSQFQDQKEESSRKDIPSVVRDALAGKKSDRSVLSEKKPPDGLNKSEPKVEIQKSYSSKGSERKSGSWSNHSSEGAKLTRTLRECVRVSAWQEPLRQITMNDCWDPFVLFDTTVVEPVKSFRELPIQPGVIKNLENGGSFKYLSQVQRWAIPAIRKQLNTVVIGSSKTGKTLSYVVALIDYVQDRTYFEELPQGNGPLVVIVASSSRLCEAIYYLCHSLLGNYTQRAVARSRIKVVMAHGGGCEREVWVNLTNGCDLLISTPHCLVRLLEIPVITNFERLACLVLDEIDVISASPFRKNVRIILEKAQFSTRERHYQSIWCGERWTSDVETLAKSYLDSYALVIGSYSEAVTYKRLTPRMYLVDQSRKAEVCAEALTDAIGRSRVVVVCEDPEEGKSLYDFLIRKKTCFPLFAHEHLLAEELKSIPPVWKSEGAVLITTDGVLNELNIREAQTLVHYGLPCKWKTNFYLRYLSLERFLRQKVSSKTEGKGSTSELTDIILIDDENHYQLPHIVDYVTRLGGKVPKKIADKCEEIRRRAEEEKHNSPLCENLLTFGRCRKWRSCRQRHVFVKHRDSRDDLPASGWVNFVVLRTHDTSCFSVRLTEHTDASGKTSKLQDRYPEVSAKVAEFYKAEENRRPHGMPKAGDVCGVKTAVPDGEVFCRGKIIEYLAVDKYEKPLEVKVKLIDTGEVQKRKSIELYELPEDLSQHPPTAVDVRTVGLQPMDFDVSWSEIANAFTDRLMTGKLEKEQRWSGKIVLALNNTLYLEPIQRKQFLPLLNTHVFDLAVRSELLKKRVAVPNDDHLPALLRLCAEGNIETEEPEEVAEEVEEVVQPQWAFFDSDFVSVRFLAAENTSTVFLQIRKFEKLLRDLEEDCQKEGAKTVSEMKGETSKKVTVGTYCLALFEDGRWNRGRVESEKKDQFYVYFVDHGDFMLIEKPNVVPISETLLLRLPCQAVECTLVGIEHAEECPLEVLREIYAFSRDGEERMYACVVRKDLRPSVTNGRKYCVNLLNGDGVSLGRMLVDGGVVRGEESEREHLTDVRVEASDEEVPEEEEEEPGLKVTDDSFGNLTDEMFEDEGAQQFLKEFASKVFNITLPPAQNPTTGGQEVKQTAAPATKAIEMGPERRQPIQNAIHLMNLHKRRRKRKAQLELKGRDEVLTPQVLWCQNQVEVELKVLVGNVEDYSLECTTGNISLRCFSGEKFYAVDLKLYGAINPEMTKIAVKAFHVAVVLTKLAFPLWPRLHADEGKLRWVGLDVESLAEREDIFSEKIRSARQEIESGRTKEGIRSDAVLPCSDSENSDGIFPDSESDEDD